MPADRDRRRLPASGRRRPPHPHRLRREPRRHRLDGHRLGDRRPHLQRHTSAGCGHLQRSRSPREPGRHRGQFRDRHDLRRDHHQQRPEPHLRLQRRDLQRHDTVGCGQTPATLASRRSTATAELHPQQLAVNRGDEHDLRDQVFNTDSAATPFLGNTRLRDRRRHLRRRQHDRLRPDPSHRHGRARTRRRLQPLRDRGRPGHRHDLHREHRRRRAPRHRVGHQRRHLQRPRHQRLRPDPRRPSPPASAPSASRSTTRPTSVYVDEHRRHQRLGDRRRRPATAPTPPAAPHTSRDRSSATTPARSPSTRSPAPHTCKTSRASRSSHSTNRARAGARSRPASVVACARQEQRGGWGSRTS